MNDDDGQKTRRVHTAEDRQKALRKMQEDMAGAASQATRDAAHNISQAIGAGTVALGLKAATPLTELAEDLGNDLGDLLGSLFRGDDGDSDNDNRG